MRSLSTKQILNQFNIMSLNAPTRLFFMISLLLAVLACVVIFSSIAIPFVSSYSTFVLLGAYVVLAASCILKGV